MKTRKIKAIGVKQLNPKQMNQILAGGGGGKDKSEKDGNNVWAI